MYQFSFIITCMLSLIYITSCNPRISEVTQKADGSPPISDLEPLSEQLEASLQTNPSDDDLDKRGWNKLSNVWGKRGWNNLSNMWGKRGWNNLSNMWGKRGWNNLSNMWGKREVTEMPPLERQAYNKQLYGGKRGWNSLTGSWGKRGWNNLSGVWGKRGWNNLSNVWGKRNYNKDDDSKRTTQWNKLNGLWGKRAADWDVPAPWDGESPDDFQGIYIPDQM
ncbi:prothoracicostatic peptide-like [Stegodyphus dumicola]|uniref:prothoracicostatic peptide-like n=1 Tax=Stegodyphus dumicola TaxID=202533 RepID=UPI0015A87569|nr:prothoracicostatic peptide-like [Stegodyphus dumicola]